MRTTFDGQLHALDHELITMGALCENAIALSAQALSDADKDLARSVPVLSAQIAQRERTIEGMCLKLLLQQQPVASDLRVISAALKMVTDMERIGDNAGDIAEIIAAAELGSTGQTEPIRAMARDVIAMVTDSIDAFVRRDQTLAEAVIGRDDVVDGHFLCIRQQLIDRLRTGTADGALALDMFMITKYLERIGDHAANIAQWVVFSITGDKEVMP